MCQHLSRRFLALLALSIGFAGLSAALVGLVAADNAVTVYGLRRAQDPAVIADNAATAYGLQRGQDPVVIAGARVDAMAGFPVSQLFVYAHTGGTWDQIPAQVDEITATGAYTTTEDRLLDGNDEIVFMAKDLGERAPAGMPITASLPISPGWYEIEVTDPLSPAQKGWAYLVHSAVLTPAAIADYVEFIPGFHRIVTADYSLGFGVTHIGIDYLTLSGSDVEILDRTKIRYDCAVPVICPLTESTVPPSPDNVIADGPVRVIARGGQVHAYGSMLQWTAPFRVPAFLSGTVRFSTDFNQAASGAVYYSAVVTDGVIVDGIADTVPSKPRSLWWQLSTPSGTLVHVAHTASISGTHTNYYVDRSEWDESDTGDKRHYGDTGVSIEHPNLPFTYSVTAYALRGSHPNVGGTYEARSTHPLSVTVVLSGDPRPDDCDWSDQTYEDFYMPPDPGQLTPDRLGELLRVEHIRSYTPQEVAQATNLPSSSYGAEAFRVLYLSQTPLGTPQAVSGLIVVPMGPVPQDGFPIVAHGHGSTGIADKCALSRSALNVGSLLPWVAQGYLVSATDYVSLGTPGLHPYAVGESEAYSVLDGARAARRFCDSAHDIVFPRAANRLILEGHSQGGHAALFAHQAWQSYAPELALVGTVAFAPGAELRFLTQHVVAGSSLLIAPAAMSMYSYSAYYGDPTGLQVWLKEPYATEIGIRIEQKCILDLTLWMGFDPERVFQPNVLAAVSEGRWDDIQPFTTYLDANTPGDFASDVPVLVLHGKDDPHVPPDVSTRLTRRLCDNGTTVKLSRYEGVRHSGITKAARPEAIQWVADRLSGVAAPDGCDEVRPRVYLPLLSR